MKYRGFMLEVLFCVMINIICASEELLTNVQAPANSTTVDILQMFQLC